MAFKLKKRIHEILQMDAEAYAKFFKKESQRATSFEELDVVVCTEHQFADGKSGALVLMGAFVGDLADFYKKNKTAPTFAKGKCRFEPQAKTTVLHFTLTTGRAKPDKLIKAGRRLWAKAALKPQAHKGKLPVSVPPKPVEAPTETATPSTDWQGLQRQYLQAKKAVQTKVIPVLQAKEETMDQTTYLRLVKRAIKAAQQWLQAYRVALPALQQSLQTTQQQLQQEYQQLQRLLQKLQQPPKS